MRRFTIYQRIASDPALKRHFRHARAYRKGRGGAKDRRGQIPDRNTKENPPAIVAEKTRVGDGEGDTVERTGKNASIATFVDKTSTVLVAKVMPNKAAATLNRAAIRTFSTIPDDFIKTITFDNGKKFSGHKALVHEWDIYFAHPYHSWERGLNEHPNGLIRQYLPKKTSFEGLPQRQLDKIVMKINNRPRTALGYRRPHEVFAECKFALRI
ncbi:MAG: IS30 family transposase [Treponema sp.]|jgi:IS30 family transposase|nr:IS30 family transposase [Treponema sp.]